MDEIDVSFFLIDRDNTPWKLTPADRFLLSCSV